MGVNGKEFAEAKSEFAAVEDYNDRWLGCVAQWRRVLQRLTLSDLVLAHAISQGLNRDVAKLRRQLTIHYGPTGDAELIDMIVQFEERMAEYEIAARAALQERSLAPNIYRDDPAAFLRHTIDSDTDRTVKVDLDALRRQRADERARWEAERTDWKAAERADEEGE